MVVVEYSYEEMKGLIDLPKDKMIAILNELGAPSEYQDEVGKIMTELTPNRPDWYSMEGLARALRAYHKNEHPKYSVNTSSYRVNVDPSVSKIRPYTVCGVVKGLKLDDQRVRDLVLLQEKLIGTLGRKVKKFGLGLYPLSAIKFPVDYTTMNPSEIKYVPLGYEKEMTADEILKNHKKGQQYGYLLKDHERYPVFVDAEKKIMALIPVVNSSETGKIETKTKEMFLEVSGMDLESCKAALNILVCTLIDMGGTAYEVRMDYGKKKFSSPDLEEKIMKLDLAEVNKILGTKFSEKDVEKLLVKMGYKYGKGKVTIPPYRADILGQIDIVEDIAIAYGYNNFIPTIPDFFNPGKAITTYDDVDSVMRGMGFMETKTFVLTNKDKLKNLGVKDEVMEINNPATVEYTVIRPNLIVDIIDTFYMNKMKGLPQKFYEIGIVQNGTDSTMRLVFGLMERKVDFSEFRGYLQTLMVEKGIEFDLRKKQSSMFTEETSCVVIAKGNEIGIMGKISETVLERFGISFDIYVCELKL